MDELKYCRVCLVMDVKMYSLNFKSATSNVPLGVIYSHLAQIQISDRDQHVCFECASLLEKYHTFKLKCIRAYNILSEISITSTVLTKQIIQNINRKYHKLESDLTSSTTFEIICDDSLCSLINEKSKSLKAECGDDVPESGIKSAKTELKIKCEIQHEVDVELNVTNKSNDENCSNDLVKAFLHVENKLTVAKACKSKKRKSKNEVQVKRILDVIHTSLVGCDDQDLIESLDKNKPVKAEICKTINKRKLKTVTQEVSSDDISIADASKINEKVDEREKDFYLQFGDYGTIMTLTPADAKKEVLKRKESRNYKISPFKCVYCYRGYEARTAFENHMKRHGVESGNYECDICHLRFTKGIYLSKHKSSCHKRKFSCNICTYVCFCIEQAKNHVSLHKGKKYPCDYCDEIFSMPNSLVMHKRIKHLNSVKVERVCELCGDVFRTVQGLSLHRNKLHGTDKNNKEGPKCQECDVQFCSEAAWKRHLVLSTKHTVINGCKYCGERFPDVKELRLHRRIHHPRLKCENIALKLPAVCTLCDKVLSHRIEYKYHMKTEHPKFKDVKKHSSDDPPTYICEVCGKAFKQKCFLVYHQRKHTGECPYKCQDCGKTYHLAAGLYMHRRVHMRRRPSVCEVCSKVLSSKGALYKHIKMVHLGIRPHKCEICNKAFTHMSELKTHVKYVHCKVPWPKRKRSGTDNNNKNIDT